MASKEVGMGYVTRLTIILALAITFVALVGVGAWKVYQAGRDREIAERAASDRKAELERKGDNATLQKLNQYDLCVAGLRGNGMPIDACQQLRGL